MLAYGLLAWLIFPVLMLVTNLRGALLIGFPLVYLTGLLAMGLALFEAPPPGWPKRGSAFLASAAAIYGLIAAGLLSIVAWTAAGGRPRVEAQSDFILLLIGLAGLLGLAVALLAFKIAALAVRAAR
jgi:hypothetical protein